ncbi:MULTISPECIES: diguanylate cyclase domain-containing protein [unclassified Massilia]|uniref:diguanylate cyclase domain-containing protein n=1 Tax=unclassified Massilia TaxID=2609279 RepID=UPI00177BCDB5|nr:MULTISPECIES: diguanylate cyclase [unclassified Massilia]MBD8532834.1 diguanylate cyclase [Massilia sp. CFBP 13647]MBD8676195.1 diguanylate cyclase [Massilia sp. CFBP 13721]
MPFATPAFASPNNPHRILLVGAPPFAGALREMLAGADDIELVLVDAVQVLEQAASLRPGVLVRALGGREDSGDFIRACRAHPVLAALPLLVLAPHAQNAGRDAAFAAGASDYLADLPTRTELLARLRYHAQAGQALAERADALRRLEATQALLARAQAELDRIDGVDSLTGIPNRRRFDQVAQGEWQRARRNGQPLSLLVCDVDSFGYFNHRLGRDAGDLCLRRMAGVLTGQLKRPSDLAARYDGKQFAILLPDTGLDGAVQVAEGCRTALERLGLSHPLPERRIVTMSVGVASTLPSDEGMFEAVLARAGEAVLAAKSRGRNRVAAFRA